MPADMIAHARHFSLWLSRQLDGGQIDVARLQPMLAQPLQPQDLAAFAPWADIAAAADEAELARQLRLLRRYVLAQIMARDLSLLPRRTTPRSTVRPSAAIAARRSI